MENSQVLSNSPFCNTAVEQAPLTDKFSWRRVWMIFQLYYPGLRKQIILMPLATCLLTLTMAFYLHGVEDNDMSVAILGIISIIYYLCPIGLARKDYRQISAQLPAKASEKLVFLILYFWFFCMLITSGIVWLTAIVVMPVAPEIWNHLWSMVSEFSGFYGMSPFAVWGWPLAFLIQTFTINAMITIKSNRMMRGILTFFGAWIGFMLISGILGGIAGMVFAMKFANSADVSIMTNHELVNLIVRIVLIPLSCAAFVWLVFLLRKIYKKLKYSGF